MEKSNRENQWNQSWFSENINNMDKLLVTLIRKQKREDTSYQYQEWERWHYRFYINYLKFFCMWDLFHMYVCICIHSFVSVWTHGYIYFILWVIIQYYFMYSVAEIDLALAIESSFSWLLFPFDFHPSLWVFLLFVFSTCLLSGPKRCAVLILYISCPSPRISLFFKGTWLLLLENGMRNQDLGTSYACCYWDVIASRLCQLTEKGNKALCTNPCIYT